MARSDNKGMKDTKHPIRLGHMSTRNSTHTPKKGKGSSSRRNRRKAKEEIKRDLS